MTTRAPKDNLIRCVTFDAPQLETVEARDLIRAEGDGDLMVGFPIVFDTMTEINSWEGQFRERIAPKALTKTLKENRDDVVVLFNHGYEFSTGDKPVAVPRTMEPQTGGLWTESRWIDRPYAQDIRELISSGAIKGMSFRFSVVKETWDDEPEDGGLPIRTINELRLFEFGPVTYPAYKATTVGVRSAADYAEWLRTNKLPDDEAATTSDTSDEAVEAERTSAEETTEPAPDHSETPTERTPVAKLRRYADFLDSYVPAIERKSQRNGYDS